MIYAVTNQKGGIGKSTTAHAIAAYCAYIGVNTLLVDIDPQANLTQAAGANPNTLSTYDLLTGKARAERIAQRISERLYILPANKNLSRITTELTETGKEYKLKEALHKAHNIFITGKTDIIIIDTPPALSTLTINALTAAERVIIPAQADIFSIEAIKNLHETIKAVRKYTNPKLEVAGILLIRYNRRGVLAREMAETMQETAAKLNMKVFNTTIRECIAIREAQALKRDIFTYAPKSNAAKDYKAFIQELISSNCKDNKK